MAEQKYSAAMIGRVLAEGDIETDSEVARKYDIPRGTIGTWRHRLPDDGEILATYAAARRELSTRWADDAFRTLTVVWAEIRRRVTENPADVKYTDLLGSVRAITEALIQNTGISDPAPAALPRLGRPPKNE